MRFLLLFILVCLIVTIPFVIWGDTFETMFTGEGAVKWLRSYGAWAWAVAMALLISDLLLPVPSTAVMGALGMIYGPLAGGLIGACGSVASGLVAYLLCRNFGRGIAVMISGEKEIQGAEGFFGKYGGWAIAVSRWMPILPEALSCMAGLAKMRFAVFFIALVCGSLPMAMLFAWLGVNFSANPFVALLICALAPVALLLVVLGFVRVAKVRAQ